MPQTYKLSIMDYVFSRAEDFGGNFTIHLVAYGSGSFSRDEIEMACAQLAHRHPLLRARRPSNWREKSFAIDSTVDPSAINIDFEKVVVSAKSAGPSIDPDVVDDLWTGLNAPRFQFGTGYQWRVSARVFEQAGSAGVFVLIVSVNHAIADGRRIWQMTSELLELLADPKDRTISSQDLPRWDVSKPAPLQQRFEIFGETVRTLIWSYRMSLFDRERSTCDAWRNYCYFVRLKPCAGEIIRDRARANAARFSELVLAAAGLGAVAATPEKAGRRLRVGLSLSNAADAQRSNVNSIMNLGGFHVGATVLSPDIDLRDAVQKIKPLNLTAFTDYMSYREFSSTVTDFLLSRHIKNCRRTMCVQFSNVAMSARCRYGRLRILGHWSLLHTFYPFRITWRNSDGWPDLVFSSPYGQEVVERFAAETLRHLGCQHAVAFAGSQLGASISSGLQHAAAAKR
ncbi:MAG: hypothetical protein ACFBRM_12655 [Pikeienuella sp.]